MHDDHRKAAGPAQLGRAWRRAVAAWRRFEDFHQAVFDARWGHARRREARTQQDTLRALLMLETLGVDNPVAYETLDLIPYMVADLHEWHRRMGRRDFGAPGGCC
ncbi:MULTISPECIES: cory-CC-star protein [unclassified Nocardiopsis]|uniref:cory-CC-star protein n=1 Tax=unclassified Nocardiopsis TaxID=2649073 RepID=UPI0019164481|nr:MULTISPECIES: cory-CC-star protein [unclassified Nocardiopsis]